MEDVQARLDELMSRLNENQKTFLEARQGTLTDKEAYEQTGFSRSVIFTWKQNRDFVQAYDIVIANPNREDTRIVIQEKELRGVAKDQLLKVAGYLPSVLEELANLALHAAKEGDRLRAIEMYLDRLGVNSELIAPVTKSKLTMQIMALVSPQPLDGTSVTVEESEPAEEGEYLLLDDGEDGGSGEDDF